MSDVKVNAEVRRENARYLLRTECDGVIAKFAEQIGKASTQVGHIIGPNPTKNIGPKIARQIERAFKKPAAWLDQERHGLSDRAIEVARLYDACKGEDRIMLDRMIETFAKALDQTSRTTTNDQSLSREIAFNESGEGA